MRIDSNFDSGNITVISTDSHTNVRLHLRKDINADHKQWFYFRASNIQGLDCQYYIDNADEASFPEAWDTCTIVASSDRKEWRRINTHYDGKTLSFKDKSDSPITYYALFAPYSYERHIDLIGKSLAHPQCSLVKTIETVNKNQVEVLQIGSSSPHKKSIWIIARQHPAETMSEWLMEGFLQELLKKDGHSILSKATLYIVPNMNPDGSIAGNIRTNGSGIDLNRSWNTPCAEKTPESFYVLDLMKKTGVDLFLDIHGDEDRPFTFAAGCEGIPNFTEKQASLDKNFRRYFNEETIDFSIENGYPTDEPNQALLDIACHQIGYLYGCLSLTIELPFLDNKYNPDPKCGWSPERSIKMGTQLLTPIARILEEI
ncbi:M14 family metallopeptidase [Pseudocolwellia agarivorans]|uniref:M14 family metallopeptidase n=1 Tax=Pseudocolwellia agarivorans TaxID=1911682 RepID=UPI000986CC14|nr:M14-type cytosolic carboxypeptidase [Pseudocolwellia agarivorans]